MVERPQINFTVATMDAIEADLIKRLKAGSRQRRFKLGRLVVTFLWRKRR